MGKVILFCDPSQPVTGIDRLRARRAYREGCKKIAPTAIFNAFTAAAKMPGVEDLGIYDALPIFFAAMRREVRMTMDAVPRRTDAEVTHA